MKKFRRVLFSFLVVLALISAASPALTANAAAKNTVKTSVSKVVSTAKGFKVTWKKKSGIKGYQIQYSTSSKFTKSTTKTKTVSGAKNVSATISKLKGCNATYYVRIRTYKTVNGKNVYSSWSAVKKVTTLNHKYVAATCTKAKTCKYCGKTSGKALGHKYAAATCTKAKTCTRCKRVSGKALGHKYAAATCTKAKTCTRCKRVSGKALGHKYAAATCTKAKTCTRCKRVSGKALGHKYAAATCTKAKTCTRCAKTSGSALGHKYTGATCTKAATCSRCKKTSGTATGHCWDNYVCAICKTVDKTHAYEYLVQWVKTNGTESDGFVEYVIDATDSEIYSLIYSNELSSLFVTFFILEPDSGYASAALSLDTYLYAFSFYGDSIYGEINPETYSGKESLTYITSDCATFSEEELLSIAQPSVNLLLEVLHYYLLTENPSLTLGDLGFLSY